MKDKSLYGLMGCGLSSEHRNTALPDQGRQRAGSSRLLVNVDHAAHADHHRRQGPKPVGCRGPLRTVIEKAIRRAKRRQPCNGDADTTQNAVIPDMPCPPRLHKASGGRQYRYSLRQLFYAVRPYVLSALAVEPGYDWFAKVVTRYEADNARPARHVPG